MTATATVHSIYPMLQSLIIDYGDVTVLPDRPAADLYAFTDSLDGESTRDVVAVYTNDQPQVRADRTSVPGRFVVVELAPVINPDPQQVWTPASTAGRAVLRTGWNFTFRTDYSDLDLRQNVDVARVDGSVLRPPGSLPVLQWRDVQWPDFTGFTVDEVLTGDDGDIHFSYYLPPGYDPQRRYPLVLTLPGYGGLLHSLDEETRGVNIFSDRNALAWAKLEEDVIVLAPQLSGGSTTSAQVIAVTEHFLDRYAVDPDRVYAVGYSAGGEMMSRVLDERADLFTAYVHTSSRWNGGVDQVVQQRVPVYVFMAAGDEYYGQQQARADYADLQQEYADAGVEDPAADLVVLDLRDDEYFRRQGIDYFHDGGQVVAEETRVTDWVLRQRRT